MSLMMTSTPSTLLPTTKKRNYFLFLQSMDVDREESVNQGYKLLDLDEEDQEEDSEV